MAGLLILVFFVADGDLRACFASKNGLDPTQVNGPRLAPPSLEYPLGTDNFGGLGAHARWSRAPGSRCSSGWWPR